MNRIGYKNFAEGQTREFKVSAAYGHGRTIDEGSYEYEGKTNLTWEMQVEHEGQPAYLKMSATMNRAVSPHAGNLGVGARFALTKVSKSEWSCVVSEANTAPPATSQMATGTPAPRKGGSVNVNPDLGHRYDKWSSPVLSRKQMEAIAGWATETAAATSLGLGLDKMPDGARAIQGVWSSLLILGAASGMPAEFGAQVAAPTATTVEEMWSKVGDATLGANLARQDTSDYICHTYSLLSSADLPANELAKLVNDLPIFCSRVAAYVAARAEEAVAV